MADPRFVYTVREFAHMCLDIPIHTYPMQKTTHWPPTSLGECTLAIGSALRKIELVRRSGWPWMLAWRGITQQGLLASQIPGLGDRHGLWVDISPWPYVPFATWKEGLQDRVGPSKIRGQMVELPFVNAQQVSGHALY